MVEQVTVRRRREVYTADWAAIHERYLAGESEVALAEVYGMAPTTLKERCRWIAQAFPPGAPMRVLAALIRRLEEAQAKLESGEPLEAERRAKAVTALVRAARALESWSMDKAKTPRSAPSHQEADPAHEDPRAELERRLLHLLDFELKQEGRGEGAGADPAQPSHDHRCDGDGAALPVEQLGETRSDPA